MRERDRMARCVHIPDAIMAEAQSSGDLRYSIGMATMHEFGSGSYGPKMLAILEVAFNEAWSTLEGNGSDKIRPEELARCVLRAAMEGERDPVRLHDRALSDLNQAITWRDAG